MVIESEMVKWVERIVANNSLVCLKSMVANLAGSKIEMLKIYTDNASTYIMAKFKLASSNMKNRFL
jgi:hypothetical protein